MSKISLAERDEEEENFEREKRAVERSGSHAIGSRGKRVRKRWDDVKIPPLTTVKVDSKHKRPSQPEEHFQTPSFWGIVREVYPTIPYKPLLYLGLFTCLASGAMTPVFSYLLSRLLFEVSTGAKDVSTINFFGGIVLTVAALDGLLLGLKYFLMETAGNTWVLRIRKLAFGNVLAQDKKWFDRAENAGVRIVQTLVKDGDDARNLVAVVMGQACVVAAMVGVGLLWAMVRGWQLTLVGMAVAPVFAGVMALQAALVARCEMRNKKAREEVAKGYYDVRFFFFFSLLG
jgi:ATP-binding cassette subfamily B (MDR/TAP) protein 1